MKNNAKKLKAKIKRAIKAKNPIYMDIRSLQHLNKIHVLMKRNGVKLDAHPDPNVNHIGEYKYYHYTSKLNMGLCIHAHSKTYMILNWQPSKGSHFEKKNTTNLF